MSNKYRFYLTNANSNDDYGNHVRRDACRVAILQMTLAWWRLFNAKERLISCR